MRLVTATFAASILAATLCVPAVSQATAPAEHTCHFGNLTVVSKMPTSDINMRELRDFHRLAESNPALRAKLSVNPRLIRNPDFVLSHPTLQGFLARYPQARHQIPTNPGDFLVPKPRAS